MPLSESTAGLSVRCSRSFTAVCYGSESDLPFLVAHLTLLGEDGVTPVDTVTEPTTERLLYGNLVSSPHVFRNLQGGQGVYFVFPDVSVRQQGQFRLQVALLKLSRCVLNIPNIMLLLMTSWNAT